MTGLLAHPFGTCEAPGCGLPLPPTVLSHWKNKVPRRFCGNTCRCRAFKAKKKATPPAPRPMVCARCGAAFDARVENRKKYCSKTCQHLAKLENDLHAPAATQRRLDAERVAAERARTERCPCCRSRLGADSSLLYCRARCGWDELLTAHERDPRADCDTPDDEAAE